MIACWFTSIRVLLVWLLGFALALIIGILWHDLMMAFIVDTLQCGQYVVQLIHLLYYSIAGLLLVAYIVLIKDYFSRAAQKGLFLSRSLLTIGIELILIGLGQAGLTLYRIFPADWPGIALISSEGLAGIGMLYFSRQSGNRRTTA